MHCGFDNHNKTNMVDRWREDEIRFLFVCREDMTNKCCGLKENKLYNMTESKQDVTLNHTSLPKSQYILATHVNGCFGFQELSRFNTGT